MSWLECNLLVLEDWLQIFIGREHHELRINHYSLFGHHIYVNYKRKTVNKGWVHPSNLFSLIIFD